MLASCGIKLGAVRGFLHKPYCAETYDTETQKYPIRLYRGIILHLGTNHRAESETKPETSRSVDNDVANEPGAGHLIY